MPLSEHEQRLLEQMERALHAEDPRLASTLRNGSGRSIDGRRVFLGCLGALVGLTGLIGGVATSIVVLGVVGFLIMLGGVLLIGSAVRSPKVSEIGSDGGDRGDAGNGPNQSSRVRTPKRTSGGSFMEKIEGRWRRRREG